MPLPSHAGSGIGDFTTSGTKRDDISDVLLSNLYRQQTILGIIPIGEESADVQAKWVEDRLNSNTITDTLGQGGNTQTTMTLSAADCGVIDVGYLLQPDTQAGTGEIVSVVNVNVPSGATTGTVTITRGYGGTTKASHSASTVWRVVGTPTYENSTLGKDMSRNRVSKSNIFQRFEINVNLSRELIIRSLMGYTPGVRNELAYQFRQRLKERRRDMENAVLFSVVAGTSDSAAAQVGGDNSTMNGVVPWLNGTANSTSQQLDTSGVFSDATINNIAKNVTTNGTTLDLLALNTKLIERVGQVYSDKIRTEQSETTRGFLAKYFMTSMGFETRLVLDPNLNDTAGSLQYLALDSGRVRIRPFALSLFLSLTAPTLSDGDAVRGISEFTLEVRNTGTDTGQAHYFGQGMS